MVEYKLLRIELFFVGLLSIKLAYFDKKKPLPSRKAAFKSFVFSYL